jgi:hypothetical protein
MAIRKDGTGEINGYHIGPGVDLRGADLEGADLGGANLMGANLTGARLKDANLIFADLKEAILNNADLAFANLTNAKLYRAKLHGTKFYFANLTNAKYLQNANLTGADFSCATVDPRHIPIIEASKRAEIASLRVSDDAARSAAKGADLEFFYANRDAQRGAIAGAHEEVPGEEDPLAGPPYTPDRFDNPEYGARRGRRVERNSNPGLPSNFDINKYIMFHRQGDPMRAVVPRIHCANGLSLSVQAGPDMYSFPRTWAGPWVSVEVGFPSRFVPALKPYGDDFTEPENVVVYYNVPVNVVNRIIDQNGGIIG